METYKLVQWPESQFLMEHPRFKECLFVQDIEGHDEVGSSAYMCPTDLYKELFKGKSKKEVRSKIFKKVMIKSIDEYLMQKAKNCCVNPSCSAELMDQISFISKEDE